MIRSDGTEIKLVDSGDASGQTTQYTNFILQSVTEARMEKHQIVETFGEPYIFFFGESPRFLDVTAVLVDSFDFNWYAEFWENYNNNLRGTKSVEQGARTYMFYDDNIVEGYMLMAQAQKTSERPLMATLSFRLYLTNYSNISFVGNPNYPIRDSVNLPADVTLTTADLSSAGSAIVNAAVGSSLQEAASLQAAQGAAQQNSGFGGTPSLTQALTAGITSTGTPSIDGILQNAEEALAIATGGDVTRQIPLRGKIADNVDEYTALLPPAAPQYSPTDLNSEVDDLSQSLVDQADLYGADINNPFAFLSLGMLPFFGAFLGFGLFGGFGPSASFGVTGFGTSAFGGINGGLGFTGSFNGAPALQNSIQQQQQNNASVGVSGGTTGAPVYGNGVPVSGGVIAGTGTGGGIPGGFSSNVGSPVTLGASPGGSTPQGVGAAQVASQANSPGQNPLSKYLGGPAFAAGPTGFSSTGGFGGSSGAGASIAVGGTPSLFSMTIVPGTLMPFVPQEESHDFFIGPDGNQSTTNQTGLTV